MLSVSICVVEVISINYIKKCAQKRLETIILSFREQFLCLQAHVAPQTYFKV